MQLKEIVFFSVCRELRFDILLINDGVMSGKKWNINLLDFCKLEMFDGLWSTRICRGIEENVQCEYFCHIRPLTVAERAEK